MTYTTRPAAVLAAELEVLRTGSPVAVVAVSLVSGAVWMVSAGAVAAVLIRDRAAGSEVFYPL